MDPRKPEQHLEGRSETGAVFAGSQKVHVGSGAAAAPSTAVPPLAHLAMEGSSSKSSRFACNSTVKRTSSSAGRLHHWSWRIGGMRDRGGTHGFPFIHPHRFQFVPAIFTSPLSILPPPPPHLPHEACPSRWLRPRSWLSMDRLHRLHNQLP